MLFRATKEEKDATKALWDPLNKFVSEYEFPKLPSGRVSGRNVSGAPHLSPQAITTSMANFIFESSPELALLRAANLFKLLTVKLL